MLTLHLTYSKKKSEDLDGVRVRDQQLKLIEVDILDHTIDLAGVNEALDYLFKKYGIADEVQVAAVLRKTPEEARQVWAEIRKMIFNEIRKRGYKQRFKSPYCAVRAANTQRFQAVPITQ